MDNSNNNWIVPLLIIATLVGCQNKSQSKKIEEAQAMARDAYAEAEQAKGEISTLEAKVEDLENRLGM